MEDIFNWSGTNNQIGFLLTSSEYQIFALSATRYTVLNSSSNLAAIPFAVFENLLKFVLLYQEYNILGFIKDYSWLYLGFWNRNPLKSYPHWFGLLGLVQANLDSLKTITFKVRFLGCMRNVR